MYARSIPLSAAPPCVRSVEYRVSPAKATPRLSPKRSTPKLNLLSSMNPTHTTSVWRAPIHFHPTIARARCFRPLAVLVVRQSTRAFRDAIRQSLYIPHAFASSRIAFRAPSRRSRARTHPEHITPPRHRRRRRRGARTALTPRVFIPSRWFPSRHHVATTTRVAARVTRRVEVRVLRTHAFSRACV